MKRITVFMLMMTVYVIVFAAKENEKISIFGDFGFSNEVSLSAYQKYVGKTIIYSPCSPLNYYELKIKSDRLSEKAKYIITEIQPDRGMLYPTTKLRISLCNVATNKKISLKAPASESYLLPFFFIDDFESGKSSIIGTKFGDKDIKGYYEVQDVRFEKVKGSKRNSELQYYIENKETGVRLVTNNPKEDIRKQIEEDKEGNYVTELLRVEKPEDSKERYGKIEVVEGDSISKYYYKDEYLSILLVADSTRFRFWLTNESENTMKLLWQDAVFVNFKGETSSVMHYGVKYADRNGIMPPSTVIRGASLDDEIIPNCNVWLNNITHDWEIMSYYPKEPSNEVSKVRIMMPIQIKDVVNEYVFVFGIRYDSKHPERLK